jgi:AcrR family transcriptional regulator
MPKLWNDTIETHRQAVRDATMDATAALIAHEGMSAVSMSRIATDTGIGRATLYKYFADVDAILLAWHERQIGRHLQQLIQARDNAPDAMTALKVVLSTYARLSAHGHAGAIAQMLGASDHSKRAHLLLNTFVRDLIGEAAKAGLVRGDVPASELAAYCLGALSARSQLSAKGAADRLIDVVLSGLRIER